MARLLKWGFRLRRFEMDVYALYLACRDPRVPWHAKLFAGLVAAYAFSPIDLIPDPLPVVGYLDDLLLIPVGMRIARRMIPRPVFEDCRRQAAAMVDRRRPVVRWGIAFALFSLVCWLAILAGIVWLIVR